VPSILVHIDVPAVRIPMGEARVRYFDALRRAAEAVNSSLTLGDVLCTVSRVTAEATRVKACSVLLLDEETNCLVHTASHGLSGEYLHKGAVSADRSLAEALQGHPIAVSDVTSDLRVQYPGDAVREGIVSMLCAPIVGRGKIMGVIRIYSSQKGDFSPSVTELLVAIANLSALAIQNARMYEAVKEAHQVCLQELWQLQP
jgi:GAF domain-containing protein